MSTATSSADIEAIVARSEAVGALIYGDFTLSSGKKSPYYFDGRLLNLDPEGSYRVAKALLPLVWETGAEAVAGPAVAGVPMVASIATISHLEGKPVPALIARKEAKGHGTGKLVEGTIRRGMKVAVIDDTCTTGGSLIQAIEAVEAVGCTVVAVLCILDRNEGGSAEVRKREYTFKSLLTATAEGKIVPTGSAEGS